MIIHEQLDNKEGVSGLLTFFGAANQVEVITRLLETQPHNQFVTV